MRHFVRFGIALPAAILLIAAAAGAQRTPGTAPPVRRLEIAGIITDDSQHTPIQGAQLRLSTSSGEMLRMSYSNSGGEFSFTAIPTGRYTLIITAEGFQENQQDVTLVADSADNLKITLRKSSESEPEVVAKDSIVSARELSLPSKAQEALAKARERLYQKHDAAGSLPYFRKVNELAPSFYEAYFEEGVAYTLQRNNAEAESAFRKAIATSEDHYSEPCFALASLLTDQKKFPEAERLARRGIEITPNAWRGDYELARALLGEGRLEEAEKSGMEARKRKQDFAGLYLILANIHLQLHNNEAVLDDVNAFLKLDPSGPNSDQAREIKSQVEHALGRSSVPGPL